MCLNVTPDYRGPPLHRLYDRPDADTSPRTTSVTHVKPEDLGDPIMEITLKPGDVM